MSGLWVRGPAFPSGSGAGRQVSTVDSFGLFIDYKGLVFLLTGWKGLGFGEESG